MRFPNAANGVGKIFKAEVLSMIAAVIFGVATLFGLFAVSLKSEGAAITMGIIMIILMCAAGVVLLVGGIINIIGYVQAARDEDGFRKAVICTIAGLVFSFVSYCFVNDTGFLGWLGTTFNMLSQVSNMLVTVFTILGLMNLSAKCNRPDMVARGSLILKELLTLYVVSLITIILIRILRENLFSLFIINFLTIFMMVTMVTVYILQLVYLVKAKNMLSEN